MNITTRAWGVGFSVCMLLVVAGIRCSSNNSSGGGGSGIQGSNSDGGNDGSNAACVNINGTWSGSAQVDATACGQGTYADTGALVVVQSAGSCSFSVAYYGYGSMSGTVSGSTVTFSGSYPKFSGTVTLDTVNLVVSADGTTISGPITWGYTGASKTCSGTTTISGTKTSS